MKKQKLLKSADSQKKLKKRGEGSPRFFNRKKENSKRKFLKIYIKLVYKIKIKYLLKNRLFYIGFFSKFLDFLSVFIYNASGK